MAKKTAQKEAVATSTSVTIKAPKMVTAVFNITGTSPYVQHRFSKKGEIMAAQQEGGRSKSKRNREAKDFDDCYEQAKHKTKDGWCGIPASAFRNAMISACKIAGFVMTRAKLSVFVLSDGVDQDGLALVKIAGTPERYDATVRNQTGVVDVRSRPMWREWGCKLRVQYDADMLTAQDIANLLLRAGMQVGVGEGRHDSKSSCGLGFGCFTLEQ